MSDDPEFTELEVIDFRAVLDQWINTETGERFTVTATPVWGFSYPPEKEVDGGNYTRGS